MSLTDGGANPYNVSYIDYSVANTSFSLVKDGEYYRIQGNRGYYATDNTTKASAVYCDKGASHKNGLWLFEEVSEDEALASAETGLPAYIAIANDFYNEIEPDKEGGYPASLSGKIKNAVDSAQTIVGNENPAQEEIFNAIGHLRNAIDHF